MSVVRFGISLPPKSIWQTIWFGTLYPVESGPSSWGIHMYLRHFSGGDSSLNGKVIATKVSMAHMHLFPIGRCIDGTRSKLLRIRPPTEQTFQANYLVDLSPENTSLVTRSSLGKFGPAGPMQDLAEYDGMLVRVAPSLGRPEIYIPCATLFQYFWGTSSRVANLVTSGHLESLDRYVCVEKHTGMDAKGRFFLLLREGMRTADAPYLATIIAEPHALEAGRHIGRSLAAQSSGGAKGAPVRLEVTPPFARPLEIDGFYASGTSVTGSPLLYLTHIISTNLRPVWDELYFSRENDATPGEDDGQPKQPYDRPSAPVHSHPAADEDIEVEESPPRRKQEKAELKLLPSYASRFPWIARRKAEKMAKISSTHERTEPATHVRASGNRFSAMFGVPTAGAPVIAAELNPSDKLGSDLDQDLTPELEIPKDLVSDRLSDFADRFEKLPSRFSHGDNEVTVDHAFLDPYHPKKRSAKAEYFRLPRRINGDLLAWLYRTPGWQHCKLGLCAEIRLLEDGKEVGKRYVLDFEPREPRRRLGSDSTEETRNGFLVVWTDDSCILSTDSALRTAIAAIARRGNPKLKSGIADGVYSQSFRHVEMTAEALLGRVFSATDQREEVPGLLLSV